MVLALAALTGGGDVAAAEVMTPLEREASTPKGQLKNPYADFASVAEEGHRKYMAAGCNGCLGEEEEAAWRCPSPILIGSMAMTTTHCSG